MKQLIFVFLILIVFVGISTSTNSPNFSSSGSSGSGSSGTASSSGGSNSGINTSGSSYNSGSSNSFSDSSETPNSDSSDSWEWSSDSSSNYTEGSGCYSVYNNSYVDCPDSSSYDSASSKSPIDDSSENGFEKVESFLVGVFEGIVETAIEDTIANCLSAFNSTVVDFRDGVRDIEIAINNISPIAGYHGVKELSEGVQGLKDIYEKCQLQNIAKDIEIIATDFETGWGAILFVGKEAMYIIHNRVELTGYFNNIVTYWRQGNFRYSGFYLGVVLEVLVEAINDENRRRMVEVYSNTY